jgi:hypothetical protein
LDFVRADAAFKTTGADVAAFDFEIAECAKKPAAFFANFRCAALRVIETTCFRFAAKRFGSCAFGLKVDGRKYRDAHGPAASAATHTFLAIPKFSRNRPGAGRAGDRIRRHYLA